MGEIYTTGEFAKRANVSIRTIRFYDKQGLLKPSHMSASGYRLYTDADFAKLQKILTLKYLGFSLEEIMDITIKDDDRDYVRQSLALQLDLVRKKQESLQMVEQALLETEKLFETRQGDGQVDWKRMLQLIHMISMEKSLVEQYKNSTHIRNRIELHQRYAANPESWFSWIYRNLALKPGERILELGCGNGQLWKENATDLVGCQVILSDISPGMIADAKENLQSVGLQASAVSEVSWKDGDVQDPDISLAVFDFRSIPLSDASCDVVIANHVLFYAKEISDVLQEVFRVLKPGGRFYCSTYGREHMKEISQLVKEFDVRIALSDVSLYDVFGLENGAELLEKHFPKVTRLDYEDGLRVTDAEPLLDYILSCHGNQQEYLHERYGEFRQFVERKLEKKGYLRITKQACMFACEKTPSAGMVE